MHGERHIVHCPQCTVLVPQCVGHRLCHTVPVKLLVGLISPRLCSTRTRRLALACWCCWQWGWLGRHMPLSSGRYACDSTARVLRRLISPQRGVDQFSNGCAAPASFVKLLPPSLHLNRSLVLSAPAFRMMRASVFSCTSVRRQVLAGTMSAQNVFKVF